MSTYQGKADLELVRYDSKQPASLWSHSIQTYLDKWQSQGRSITALQRSPLLHFPNAQHQESFLGMATPETALCDSVSSQVDGLPAQKIQNSVGTIQSGLNALIHQSNTTVTHDSIATAGIARDFWDLWPMNFDSVESAQPSTTVSCSSGPNSDITSCSPVTAAEYSTCYSDGSTACWK